MVQQLLKVVVRLSLLSLPYAALQEQSVDDLCRGISALKLGALMVTNDASAPGPVEPEPGQAEQAELDAKLERYGMKRSSDTIGSRGSDPYRCAFWPELHWVGHILNNLTGVYVPRPELLKSSTAAWHARRNILQLTVKIPCLKSYVYGDEDDLISKVDDATCEKEVQTWFDNLSPADQNMWKETGELFVYNLSSKKN